MSGSPTSQTPDMSSHLEAITQDLDAPPRNARLAGWGHWRWSAERKQLVCLEGDRGAPIERIDAVDAICDSDEICEVLRRRGRSPRDIEAFRTAALDIPDILINGTEIDFSHHHIPATEEAGEATFQSSRVIYQDIDESERFFSHVSEPRASRPQ